MKREETCEQPLTGDRNLGERLAISRSLTTQNGSEFQEVQLKRSSVYERSLSILSGGGPWLMFSSIFTVLKGSVIFASATFMPSACPIFTQILGSVRFSVVSKPSLRWKMRTHFIGHLGMYLDLDRFMRCLVSECN